MGIKYSNNAKTTLSSGINDSVTSATVASGAVFPALSGGDYFYATIETTNFATKEIVKVTARSGDTLTIVRAQDNTSAAAFSSGDFVELRVTAAVLEDATEPTTGITAGTVIASKAIITDSNKDITGGRNITISGELDAGSLDISGDVDVDGTLETDALSIASTAVTSTAAELNILDGVTSTTAELNLLDTATAGTTVNSKAVIYGSGGNIAATDIAVSGSGNRSITITSSDGIASMEIGSASSNQSFLDLKTPSGDDFDVRLGSEAAGAGGSLTIAGGTFSILGSGETMATFADDGAVTLYYDNVAKLATTSTGAAITTSADTSAGLRISRASGGGIVDIESYNAIGGIGTSDNIPFRFNTNNTERVRILNDGKVGIGTSSPSTPLHVNGDVTVAGGIAGATSISGGALGGRRNAIYNPTFSVNQRHGTGANTTMNTYAMDRWRCFGGGSGQAHSWTTRSDAGEGDGYYSRFQRPAGNTATAQMGIAQGLETIDSRYFAGKEVTLSFRARGGANWSPTSGNVGFHLVGGEGTDENPVSMTNTDTIIGITAGIPQGGGFVQYSGTATVPADKTQLALQISWATVGTAGANDYWDLREVQLELGDTVTQFEQRTYGEEFQLCQRYFEKSDDPVFHINCGAAASQVQRLSIRYATQKMKDATLVVSSSTSGLSGVVTNGVDGFTLGFSGSDLDVHHNTFTAEAEL